MSTDSERFGEYVQRQTTRQQQYTRKNRLKEAVETANEHLATNQYFEAACVLRDVILPTIGQLEDSKPMAVYHQAIGGNQMLPWHWSELKQFKDSPDLYCRAVSEDADTPLQTLQAGESGATESQKARDVVRKTLESVESISAYHSVTEAELKNKADAMGFSIKLGEHHQRPDMNFGDPVKAITRELGALKHYFTGGTSGGKSNGAGRQMEDYYRASVGRGRDYKCLDPVGMSTENVDAYDVPQWQDPLRNAREKQNLPPDWTEIDGYKPKAEFLVPLSPDLKEYEIPHYVDSGEPVPDFFTIPASDLSEGLLTALLDAQLSDGETRTIRQAYREVDRQHNDWSLDDLARAIRGRSELSEKDQQSAVRVLENLQSEGFIRTAEDEHTLDTDSWFEMFHDTDVATVFNQSPIQRKESQYLIIAYIIDRIWTLRINSHELPDLATWLRELHSVAPHQGIRRREDDTVQNLMEYIISVLSDIMRMPRDISTHIVADTQDPGDVEKGIRKRFNRYVVFGGADDDIQNIFKWAGQNNWRSFRSTLSDKPGRAGIIKGCGPAIGDPNRWGISPVHLSPPSWHHHDKDEGPSGWAKRVRISRQTDAMDEEELRIPSDEWDYEANPTGTTDVDSDEEEREFGEPEKDDEEDPREQLSTKELAKMQARQLRSHTDLGVRDIADEIPDNPETGENFSRTTVSNWTADIDKGSGELVLELDE